MSCPEEMYAEAKMNQNDVLVEMALDQFADHYKDLEKVGVCESCEYKNSLYGNSDYPDGEYCHDCSVDHLVDAMLDDN